MSGLPRARVLVVEDRGSVRGVLSAILAPVHEVTACADGAVALALLAAREFDAVITDVRLPGMSGLELLRAVRRHAPRARVLVMTAWANARDAAAALALGAREYLAKPVDADDLLLAVARAVDPLAGAEGDAPEAAAGQPSGTGSGPGDAEVEAALRRAEASREAASRRWLAALLRTCGGDLAAAAARAGLNPAALQRLLDRYAAPGEAP